MWELGVKEVWKVAKPLRRVIHTMGWPLRTGKRYREFGGSFVYPIGDDMVTIGMVVGLDYRDTSLSVHDLLQELKTHPKIRKILEGGERWSGARRRSRAAASFRCRSACTRPGLLLCGDGVGIVNVPRAEGDPLRDRVGPARGRGRVRGAAARRVARPPRRAPGYDDAVRESYVWTRPEEGAQHAPAFRHGFYVGGALAVR